NAEADRAFLADLGLPSVDVGGGWMIYGLPPGEVAVHPTEDDAGSHELFLMVTNIEAFVSAQREKGRTVSEIKDQPWGRLVSIVLPSGSRMGVYEPRHASPPPYVATPPLAK